MRLLEAAHRPLLMQLGLVVGISALLLSAINNLKIDIIFHALWLN